MVENICVPECSPACVNGNCVAPGDCNCSQGYHKTNESYICEPARVTPCENVGGDGLNNCTWEPTCDLVMVQNGVCTAPNILRCNEGFVLSDAFTSKPTCVSNEAIIAFYTETFIKSVRGISTVVIIFGVILVITTVVIRMTSKKNPHPNNDTVCNLNIDSPISCNDDNRKVMNLTTKRSQAPWSSIAEQRTNVMPSVSLYDTPISPPIMAPLHKIRHAEQIVNVNNSTVEYHFYESIEDYKVSHKF